MLEACVKLCGAKPYEEVRKYMDEADIFLFTSNRQEGWGAVLNEAMNSGCAVIADRNIGAVPFLLEHEKNGLIYDGSTEDLCRQTETLIVHSELRRTYGEEAYKTVVDTWNAEVAAERFVLLSEKLLRGEKNVQDFRGPCEYIG